jgi:hypothetical protein
MASTLADDESTPLISPNSKGEGNSFYFISQAKQADTTKEPDGGIVEESLPPGANPDEFAPRVLGAKVSNVVCFRRNLPSSGVESRLLCFYIYSRLKQTAIRHLPRLPSRQVKVAATSFRTCSKR